MKIQESSSLNKLSFVVFCFLSFTSMFAFYDKTDKFVDSNGCSLVNYEK